MGSLAMAVILLGLWGAFAATAHQRLLLLLSGQPRPSLLDLVSKGQLMERVRGVITYAFAQKRMHNYPLAGLAHQLIFLGFVVLLLNTIILWGRGFYAPFNLFILGHEPVLGIPLGIVYELVKELFAILVVVGASVFVWFRAVKHEARMTLSGEGLLILGIIITMMVADMLYGGATIALASRMNGLPCGGANAASCEAMQTVVAHLPAQELGQPLAFHWYAPASSVFAFLLSGVANEHLVVAAHAGFWIHSTLVLLFLNILPFSKHFHIITAVINVFFRPLDPPGRLPLVAPTSEALGAMVEQAFEGTPGAKPVGKAVAEDFSWKAVLDFYTCTECGRCSDNCPAHKTGKMLSPKALTLNLRDNVFARSEELVPKGAKNLAAMLGNAPDAHAHDAHAGESAEAASADTTDAAAPDAHAAPVALLGNVVHPDVLWACTTCRACEEQCPVMISYVDKIVEMRRNLVLVKGEFPAELNNPFGAMETNGNPWNLSRVDRANWADGLDITLAKDKPDAKVLYWVGCAASYDDRAKKVARATASLLKEAKVDFAILGDEETCTGDPARRAGNEYLFMMLAEQNAATLNGYKEQGGVRTIVTACPHCFNTLANEYPDFGAKFEVVHHTDFLLGLLAEKKLKPTKAVKGKVVYHDSCYLGRYNGVYEQPRDILRKIDGVELVEAEGWNRSKGLCCGAGGAQMWMEEQNKDRVNVKRTSQLLDTGATTIASGCPFCQTMLTDGLKAQSKEDEIKQLDVAEILATACGVGAAKPKTEAAVDDTAST